MILIAELIGFVVMIAFLAVGATLSYQTLKRGIDAPRDPPEPK